VEKIILRNWRVNNILLLPAAEAACISISFSFFFLYIYIYIYQSRTLETIVSFYDSLIR
jgi:hypothetical protein